MLEVNDIVKVISATDSGYLGAMEFIQIGTVCRVVNVEKEKDGSYEETNIEEYCYHKGQNEHIVDYKKY